MKMKQAHIPIFFFSLTLIFAILLSISERDIKVVQASTDTAVTTQRFVTGFAWSSNIGWISMRGANYGVEISPTGELSGYAWSSNIGWISFNADDLASCPNGPCTPSINEQTGAVTGWIRACAGTISGDCKGQDRADGWQGWIELSGSDHVSPQSGGGGGVTYVPSTSNLTGYAWGSDVVGWINFTGVSVFNDKPIVDISEYGNDGPPVISEFKMIPNLVNKGQSCTMNWQVQNADNCTIIGDGYASDYKVSLPNGSDNTAPITSAELYTLTCTNTASSTSKTAACRLNPNAQEN